MQVVCTVLILVNSMGLMFNQERSVKGLVVGSTGNNLVVDFSNELYSSEMYGPDTYKYKHLVVHKDQCVEER